MNGHSQFAPSSADRWSVCQISLLPYSGPSCRSEKDDDYAGKGTACHKAGARAIAERLDPIEYVLEGETFCNIPFTIDMAEMTGVYVTACLGLIDQGYEYYIEQRVEASQIHEDCFGTVDFGAHHEAKRHVIAADFKSGSQLVYPDTLQAAIYLIGCVELFNIDNPQDYKFTAAIVQPTDKDEPVKLKDYTWKELCKIGHMLKRATTQNNAKAGDHCKYCPHAGVCEVLDAHANEVLPYELHDKEDFPALIQSRTPEQIAEILDRKEAVNIWFGAVAAYAYHSILLGTDIPGYEVRESRSNRFYANPAAAEKKLHDLKGDDIYEPRVLKSPAQIEKVWPALKPVVKELTDRKVTGAKLKRVNDDKPISDD